MTRPRHHRPAHGLDGVLASDWYALMLGDGCQSVESALRARFGSRSVAAAGRVPALRGLLLHRAARAFDLVAIVRSEPGADVFLVLQALRRRQVVLLELIGPGRRRSAIARLRLRVRAALERPLFRRAMASGQVLTEGERREHSRRLRLPEERFPHIPWPLVRMRAAPPPPKREGGGRRVVSSGRAYCDWETLFAAARGRGWDLLAICSSRDHKRVRRLAAEVGAEVRCEVSREEHDRCLAEADVYALCLQEGAASAGQVRLAAAVGAGVPVVASRVPALEGYADSETAVLVAPADPAALGSGIDNLLQRPVAGRRLREQALRRASAWTYDEYFGAIRSLLDEALRAQMTSTR